MSLENPSEEETGMDGMLEETGDTVPHSFDGLIKRIEIMIDQNIQSSINNAMISVKDEIVALRNEMSIGGLQRQSIMPVRNVPKLR